MLTSTTSLPCPYLSAGSGAKFVGFLQPYFSIKHKVLGEADQAVVKAPEPSLPTWMDEVFPVPGAKLEKSGVRTSFVRLRGPEPACSFTSRLSPTSPT